VLILPDYFPRMVLALVTVFAVVMLLYLLGWKVIDWITPGDLGKEMLGYGRKEGIATRPNVALAIVVAAMILGLAMILAATVVGVLLH